MDGINVTVENGVVTLSGQVSGYPQWRTVCDAAQYTAGVIDVRDNLRVSYA